MSDAEGSNAEGSFRPGPGGPGQDRVTGFFLAMRDAWLAAVKESQVSPPMPGGNPPATSAAAGLLAPMAGVLGAMADFAAAASQRLDQPGGGPAARPSSPGPNDAAAAANLLLPIGHAMMIAANSSFSYWLGLAHIFESHQAKLTQAAGLGSTGATAAGPEGLAAADELRALFREVGDLATREARLLQNELAGLDENLAQTLQPSSDPSGAYRRRWRSKM
jgi:hypothetical protein